MKTTRNTPHPAYSFGDSHPDFGMQDIRIFWLAALAAVVAVIAVAYFKMGY